MSNRHYYAYVYFRPWNFIPCYVGKGGRRGRYLDHTRCGENHENKHFANIFKKARRLSMDVPVFIVRENLTEKEAFRAEVFLIKLIGRQKHGGPLVNLTDGGEGSSGAIVTQRVRDQIRKALVGIKKAKEHCEAVSKAKRGIPLSKKHKKSLSKSWAVTRAKRVDALKRAWVRTRKARTGQKRTPEQRAKMSAWQIGRKMSDEARAKMSAAAKLRHALRNNPL